MWIKKCVCSRIFMCTWFRSSPGDHTVIFRRRLTERGVIPSDCVLVTQGHLPQEHDPMLASKTHCKKGAWSVWVCPLREQLTVSCRLAVF